MANIAVITGVSKGLGASLARLSLENGIGVIGISRTENKKLPEIAEENNQFYKHYPCDLSDIPQLEATIDKIHETIENLGQEQRIEVIYLLNNAGVINPINQAKNIQTEELIKNITINTISPMVLTNQLLKGQEKHEIPIHVANVTSGAAEDAVYGWSAYCSTKASMNMYTRTVALEQEELGTGNKIIAFSPGVMDTGMQEEIRASDKEEFAAVERFREYKASNFLQHTDIVAGVLIDILTDENVKNGKIYKIKDYI